MVKHKWFSSFDWASIENGEAKPPYVPNVTGKDDVTNFDQFDEGDAPVSVIAMEYQRYLLTTYFSACQRLDARSGEVSPRRLCPLDTATLV